MSRALLIYGATGYSGGLVARLAAERGWAPIVAGRDAARVEAFARRLDVPARVTAVGDPDAVDRMLVGVGVLLNAAGPFSATAEPLLAACLRAGVHYLDLGAEVPAIERLATYADAARARGVMIMPAVGFDVVASDCLAVHVARRVPGATRLAIGITNLRLLSRGSAKTLVQTVDGGLVRRDGALVPVPLGALEHTLDYGEGPRASVSVSLADLTTAYHSTGIPNVATYTEATPFMRALLAGVRAGRPVLRTAPAQAWLGACAELLPEDPTTARPDAAAGTQRVVVEAVDDAGTRAVSRLETPEAYAFTPHAAGAVLERVLAGDVEPGFETPGRVYGPDLVLGLPGVVREDLA